MGGGIGQKKEKMNLLKDRIIYAIYTDPSPTQFYFLQGKVLVFPPQFADTSGTAEDR